MLSGPVDTVRTGEDYAVIWGGGISEVSIATRNDNRSRASVIGYAVEVDIGARGLLLPIFTLCAGKNDTTLGLCATRKIQVTAYRNQLRTCPFDIPK